MCWKHGSGGAEDERYVHKSAAVSCLVGYVAMSRTIMAGWRASVDAAEARKAEVASVEAVLKPIPPFLTGSVACSH